MRKFTSLFLICLISFSLFLGETSVFADEINVQNDTVSESEVYEGTDDQLKGLKEEAGYAEENTTKEDATEADITEENTTKEDTTEEETETQEQPEEIQTIADGSTAVEITDSKGTEEISGIDAETADTAEEITGSLLASGSMSVNKKSLAIEAGSKGTFKITLKNAVGRIKVKSSKTSVAKVSSKSVWLDSKKLSGKKSQTITVTGVAAGTATITVKTVDVASYDTSPLAVKKTYKIKVTVTDKPSAPSGFAVKMAAGGIKISWKSVANAKKYQIYRQSGSTGKWAKLKTAAGTSYTDAGVSKGTLYAYKVRAVNSYGKSAFTAEKKAVFLKASKISAISSQNDGIKITWNASKKAGGYLIYKKSESGKYAKLADVTATSYLDRAVADGTTYSYFIIPYKKISGVTYKGYYKKSSAKSVLKMTAPQLKKNTSANSGVKVRWKPASGAVKYIIYRKAEGGKYKKIGTSTIGSYNDTKAEAGVKYYYTVKAVDSFGNKSRYRSEGSIGVYVPQTKVKKLINSSSGIRVVWGKVSNITGYTIYCRLEKGQWQAVKSLKAGKKSYYHYSSFISGSNYQYQVRPYITIDGVRYYSAYNKKNNASIYVENMMIISPLANGTALCTWEYNERDGIAITRITPHQMVAHWTAETAAKYFVNNGIENSVNYCIGYDGSIWCNVTEDHRAWTSSSWSNDVRAITIELSNTEDVYSGQMTDATINAFIELCVDLIQRYPSLGGQFNYTGDLTGNISLHEWFSDTNCPGSWFKSKLPEIQERVNARLKENASK